MAFLLFVVFVAPTVEVCHDVVYLDQNTASLHGYREWPAGLRTGFWTKTSPLEAFMQTRWPGVVQHRWRRCFRTGKNLFGGSISFSDGVLGDEAALQNGSLTVWMDEHSEKDARALFDFLSTADKDAADERAKKIVREFDRAIL